MTKNKKVPIRRPIKAIVLYSDKLISSLTFVDTSDLNHAVSTAIRTLAYDIYEQYREHQQFKSSSSVDAIFCPTHGQFCPDFVFCPKCACKLIHTRFDTVAFLEFVNSYFNMGRYDYDVLTIGDFEICSPIKLLSLKSENVLEIEQDVALVIMGALLMAKPDLKKQATDEDVAQAVKAYKTFVKENSK